MIYLAENKLYDYGFGKVWENVHIIRRARYYSSVTDYHKHDFYEINLVLSGNIKILLKDSIDEGNKNRIVLTRPNTPHFITCNPDTLYSRIYLVFTDEFIADYLPNWQQLSAVFGKNGTVLTIDQEQTEIFKNLIENIEKEEDLFGKRLLIYYLLLKIFNKYPATLKNKKAEPYIFGALTYIENHYTEKIDFTKLAKQLYIGRTTLMTEFKAYTGNTLGEYLTKCRIKNAIPLLKQKNTIEYAAEKCGFSDSSGFIRAFKRIHKTTPYKYVKNLK